jgi:hypothetical protein
MRKFMSFRGLFPVKKLSLFILQFSNIYKLNYIYRNKNHNFRCFSYRFYINCYKEFLEKSKKLFLYENNILITKSSKPLLNLS